MARKKKFIPPEDWYINLTHKLMDSPEWKSLRPTSIVLLLHLMRYGRSGKQFFRVYDDIEESTGLSDGTVTAAFEQLKAVGFIEDKGKQRNPNHPTRYASNVYKLSGKLMGLINR
ncbi:MAG: hypothetical protein FIA99_19145 [Ruminiclostridium sp.]|nr:hypothetical protein [Ruminiclostridium sp.]